MLIRQHEGIIADASVAVSGRLALYFISKKVYVRLIDGWEILLGIYKLAFSAGFNLAIGEMLHGNISSLGY